MTRASWEGDLGEPLRWTRRMHSLSRPWSVHHRTLSAVLAGAIVGALVATVWLGQASSQASSLSLRATDSLGSRARVFGGSYGSAALTSLGAWRSSLFHRMARQYSHLEYGKVWGASNARESGGFKALNTSALRVGRWEPRGQEPYNAFDPVLRCPRGKLKRHGGNGDGGKWLCLEGLLDQPGCVIYSMGSNEQWEFELAMLELTRCEIHTFDCTSRPRKLAPRHHFHSVCIGGAAGPDALCAPGRDCSADVPGPRQTWNQVTQRLGHERVHLLKIDIEGYEFDVLSEWMENESCALPLQLSVELHHNLYLQNKSPLIWSNLFWAAHDVSLGEMVAFAAHLGNLGYAPLSREANPEGMNCCAEFTFMRVEHEVGCRPYL